MADDKYPTNAYILAAEFNVGSNCHTSLESYLFGKPTINWRPDKKESYFTYKAINAVSKGILDYRELEKICNEWFLKNKKFKNKITVKKKRYSITKLKILTNTQRIFKKNISIK